MTEWSSDEEDRPGRAGQEITPDDFDFDISSLRNPTNLFGRTPVENKKTDRLRSKTDHRNPKVYLLSPETASNLLSWAGQGS